MAIKRGDGLYERKGKDGKRTAWIFDVWIDGERFYRSFDASLSRTEARKLATVERSNYVQGKAGIRKRRDISFDDAADLFLEHSRTNPKHRTIRYHEQTIAKLREGFSGKRLSQITAFSIEGYRKRRSVTAPRRVNRETDVLRALYNRMIEWGKYEGPNPAAGIKKHPEPQQTIRFLYEDEERRLLAECKEPLRTILLLGIYCGLRVDAEVLNPPILWSSVDFRQGKYGLLTIESRSAKTTKTRHIPLNAITRSALEAHRNRSTATGPDDPVFVNRRGKPLRSIRTIFEAARKRAGLEKSGITIHTLGRHTFTSRLVAKGNDLRSVQELGGWSSLKMLERYSHLAPGHLQSVVDSLAEPDEESPQKSQQLDSAKRRA